MHDRRILRGLGLLGASVNDADLARLAAAAYDIVPNGQVLNWRDVRAVVTTCDGGVVIAIRGTIPTHLADLLRDAEAWPELSSFHPALGRCHGGFLEGAQGILPLVKPLVAGRRVIITGHSLGGGIALILAGLLVLEGVPPALLVTWEAPRVGGAMLRGILDRTLVRQYRFGNDPITEVPWLPGVYGHVREPLIPIGHTMPDPLSCHSMAGIVAWMDAAAAVPSLQAPAAAA